jgi:hypothetical protein
MRLLLVLCLSGCVVSEKYMIAAGDLQSTGIIPAERVKHPAQVQIFGDTIDRRSAKPMGDRVQVRAGRKSQKLLAGHLLTWIGTAISLTGNALFIAYYGQDNPQYYSGIGLTASAEPLMIVGTILWILALREHPAEVR